MSEPSISSPTSRTPLDTPVLKSGIGSPSGLIQLELPREEKTISISTVEPSLASPRALEASKLDEDQRELEDPSSVEARFRLEEEEEEEERWVCWAGVEVLLQGWEEGYLL